MPESASKSADCDDAVSGMCAQNSDDPEPPKLSLSDVSEWLAIEPSFHPLI